MENKTYIYDNREVILEYTNYFNNNNLAVMMTINTGDLYAVITKNIEPLSHNEACIDTNNLPDIETFLLHNNIAEPTGKSLQSGFCTYPIYKFKYNNLRRNDK